MKGADIDGETRTRHDAQNMVTRLLRSAVLVLVLLAGSGCYVRDLRWMPLAPPRGRAPQEVVLETTGYCACGKCCSWKRSWFFGQPVYAAGAMKGKPKKVGITSSGVRARRGTIAADLNLFPYGTIMLIPGYGYGRVEDRGGAIKGHHVDLFFTRHSDAIHWGRVKKKVKVWQPVR